MGNAGRLGNVFDRDLRGSGSGHARVPSLGHTCTRVQGGLYHAWRGLSIWPGAIPCFAPLIRICAPVDLVYNRGCRESGDVTVQLGSQWDTDSHGFNGFSRLFSAKRRRSALTDPCLSASYFGPPERLRGDISGIPVSPRQRPGQTTTTCAMSGPGSSASSSLCDPLGNNRGAGGPQQTSGLPVVLHAWTGGAHAPRNT